MVRSGALGGQREAAGYKGGRRRASEWGKAHAQEGSKRGKHGGNRLLLKPRASREERREGGGVPRHAMWRKEWERALAGERHLADTTQAWRPWVGDSGTLPCCVGMKQGRGKTSTCGPEATMPDGGGG
jgi:hypothetical protein